MSSHPDADAFVAAILRSPSEITGRLAFADWLEERGGIPNIAWAYYVRLHVEIEAAEALGKKCGHLRHEAATHVPYLKVTLQIPSAVIVATHDAFEQILPASRCTVTLADCDLPMSAIDRMPAALAHEELMLPLSYREESLVVAMGSPHKRTALASLEHVEFVLNTEIVPVQADEESLRAEILHYYGRYEVLTEHTAPDTVPLNPVSLPGVPGSA